MVQQKEGYNLLQNLEGLLLQNHTCHGVTTVSGPVNKNKNTKTDKWSTLDGLLT